MTGPQSPRAPATVLVVEDDPELQYLLDVVLSGEGRRVLLAATAVEGRRFLDSEKVDLLVLDLVLPDMDGRTLLKSLRSADRTASLPVVVLTSKVGKDVKAECFELGADAFVEKPFDPESFVSDIAVRLEQAARQTRTAFHDEGTGLLNLPGLLRALKTGAGGPRALLVAEVDGLRELVARHGWQAGAAVEREMAHRIQATAPGCELARTGFGEFASLSCAGDEDALVADAANRAEAVLQGVRSLPIAGPDGETFRLTASVAVLTDRGSTEPQAWIEEARGLVQAVKQAGGNRVARPEAAGPAGGDPPLVLVAEDDDITARILIHRLEREGFRVVRFDNGQDAYLGALERVPALVLLDVKMPGMDGFEILERLRRTPSYAAVPIMLLTSLGSETDVVRGFALGADEYMPKPFSPVELIARLRRLMRRGRSVG